MNQPLPGNWWSRNWKWFVPAGCLTAIVVAAGFVVLVLSIVATAMKSSDVYGHALAEARRSPEVASALGSPLGEGWFTSGSIDVKGPSGTADLAIPVSGPRGKGTVFVEARKSAGEWSYSKLIVRVDRTGERIDLLPGDGSGRPPREPASGS